MEGRSLSWLGLDLDGGLRPREHAAGGVFCGEGAGASALFRFGRAAVACSSNDGVLGRAFLHVRVVDRGRDEYNH